MSDDQAPAKKPDASVAATTTTTYDCLHVAYDYFNKHLFESSLPGAMFTLERSNKFLGYFHEGRYGTAAGVVVDQICMNAASFGIFHVKITLSTLVHEMVHQHQHHYGTPPRGRYHDREWAEKMESIGLMPSTTGEPGGKKTGDRMHHYIIAGGKFEQLAEQLLSDDFKLEWFHRFPPPGLAQARLADIRKGVTGIFPAPSAEEQPKTDPQIGPEETARKDGEHVVEDTSAPSSSEQAAVDEKSVIEMGKFRGSDMDEEVATVTLAAKAYNTEELNKLGPNLVVPPPPPKNRNKTRYTCPACGTNAWGKDGINLICGEDNQRLVDSRTTVPSVLDRQPAASTEEKS